MRQGKLRKQMWGGGENCLWHKDEIVHSADFLFLRKRELEYRVGTPPNRNQSDCVTESIQLLLSVNLSDSNSIADDFPDPTAVLAAVGYCSEDVPAGYPDG